MTFDPSSPLKSIVADQGRCPDEFLTQILATIGGLPDDVFEPNPHHDIYSALYAVLGPWSSTAHRRSVMCEALRVLAGFESSWRWEEGVDTTNATSMSNPLGEETGAFQVSADSMGLDPSLRAFIVGKLGTDHASAFIAAMKSDHGLAVEYVARLLRISIQWDGPIRRGEVAKAVRRDAVNQWQSLLAVQSPAVGAVEV